MFGKKLKDAMKKAGYTQEEFSKITNINRSLISQWINGKKPSINSIKKIAETLNVPVGYLMDDDQEKISENNELILDLIKNQNKIISEINKKIDIGIKLLKKIETTKK